MTEQKLTDEQGFKEDKVMRMFFGQGVDTMARDGYDGSKQEKHIFMEVFNVINAGNASNHNVALHTMNFQKGESSQSNLNCENSVLTSYFSIKDSSGEASRPACIYSREVSGSGCFLDDSSSGAVSDPCNAHVKQMKLSSIEQQNHKSVEQSYSLSVSGDDLIDVGQSENYSSVLMQHQQQSPCLIVETCGHGILSSYHLPKTEEEIGGSDDIALNIECKSQDVRDDKIANEAKSVTSPVSQGSFASGLLVLSATDTPAETPEVPICMKHIMKESSILKCGAVDVASKRVLIRELPERLRSHANCLLIDAGWKIEPRVRSDRTKLASYFIAPKEKLVVTSFSQAWKACGKRLYASVMDSEQEDNGREWTNIDRFRGDLTDTLSYIEKKTQTTGISISLLKRWQLLDPFVAVICINRKIGVLQEGRALKAVKSATFILSGENNIVLADESVDRVAHLAKLNSSSGTCLNHNVSAIQLDHKSEKVTEVSRKQQRLQNYHDLQGSSQCKRQKQQLRCCAETQRRCLKSLAGCMENGLHDTRCSLNMSYKDLASPNNAVNGSDSLLTFTAKDLCSTHSGSFGDFSAQDSLTPVLETSPTDDLNTYKVAFINKSLSLQESSVPSGPSAELLVRNQPCKCKPNKKVSKEVRQQRTVIPAKRRVYVKNHSESVCCDRPDLLGHENPANVMRVADEKLEMETSACNPGCNDGRLAFNIHSSITTKKVVVRASKSKDPNSSGNQVSDVDRKIHKKSKRISDIRATEVDGTCDGTCTEVLSSHFDVKIDDHLESLCNQENSQRLLCKSTLGCMKENSCKMEACSTINIWRKTMKSETKASSQHVKAKKGNLATSLEVKMASTSTDADIDDEDIQYFKKKGCNSKGLSSQVPSLPKLPSLSNKNHHKCAVPEYSFVTSDDGNIATGGKTKNSEVLCHVGISPDPKDSQKDAKPKEPEACKKSKWKRPRGFRINDDDLLIAAIIKNKDYVSCKDKQGSKLGVSQPKKLKKLESQKGGCKLLLRAPGKGGLSKDGKEIILGARTVLCWLIERGVLSLKDVLQYRTSKNNAMVKDGWITRNGILCKCCMKIFSVSAFKAHSGSKLQKPSSNLFLQSGRSYTLCQLQAWSAEYKMRKGRRRGTGVDEVDQNDDACGLCGDGGELICCDNCPSTYHQTCLTIKDLPEGSWYCHNCICRGCEHAVNATKEASSSLAVLECSQCEHKYHDICVKKRNLNDGEVESDTWFCGRKCQEVYLGLRSRIGILNCLGDGFSWTILRCNHDDQKIQSTQKIVLMAECNTKLAIALSIMEECFLRMVDPRTGIDMIPHLLYNWGSKFTRLNYQGFYTVVLEKSDEVISVASIRVHGVTMAEMPLIATCSEYRQQGMCRRLIDAIEEMLKSFKVKMLLLSAIPSLVNTWTSHFGFKPIDDAERRQLNHVNLMLLPGTVLLIKNLEEEEESGSKSDSCLRDNQSMNPDGFNDETGRTDSDEEALLPTMNVTYQMEEHDLQQKDLLISSCGMPTSTAKHNDNDVRISGSLCRKIANLNIQKIGQFDSAEHIEQDTFTCMSVVSKSTSLHSCSASVTIRAPDDQFPADPVAVVPIVNNSESEKVSILSETEAKHIMEEDNRLLIEGDVIEEKVLFILQK